jgi:hypothetical protein
MIAELPSHSREIAKVQKEALDHVEEDLKRIAKDVLVTKGMTACVSILSCSLTHLAKYIVLKHSCQRQCHAVNFDILLGKRRG